MQDAHLKKLAVNACREIILQSTLVRTKYSFRFHIFYTNKFTLKDRRTAWFFWYHWLCYERKINQTRMIANWMRTYCENYELAHNHFSFYKKAMKRTQFFVVRSWCFCNLMQFVVTLWYQSVIVPSTQHFTCI